MMFYIVGIIFSCLAAYVFFKEWYCRYVNHGIFKPKYILDDKLLGFFIALMIFAAVTSWLGVLIYVAAIIYLKEKEKCL